MIKNAFDEFLNEPNSIGKVPHLFEFELMPIPKESGNGFRPIAL